MTESLAQEKFRISPWKAEFLDPSMERKYRERIMERSARELQIAVAVWALLLLLFSFNDYTVLGYSPEFRKAFVSRVIVVIPLFVFVIVLGRRPRTAVSGIPVTVLVIYGFTCFFALYFLYPPEAVTYIIMVTLVMLISLFVFLPNRLVLASVASLYGIAGTTTALALTTPVGPRDLASFVVLLSLPAIIGFIAAYRLNTTWRREFAALLEAETANAELRREIERRVKLEEELRVQASIDHLTGLYNRRSYEKLFEQEFGRARRHNTPLALCVLDLDLFKEINDRYGHASGDVALLQVASACRAELRESDIVGRLGGEEFILILPHTDAAGAVIVADRLRERIAEMDVEAGDVVFRITASFGVTELRQEDGSINDLVRRADAALYRSKAEGRNRVCMD